MRKLVWLGGILALALVAGGASSQTPLSASATDQPPPAPPPPAPAADATCDASTLLWLIGKPRTAIPVPVQPATRRVYCSTCMVTQDYVPGRTDIVFDAETGLVTAVKCG
ncbi:MAG TPA: hypothetical protein VKU90_08040 [Caulobacteraceae bacterium]|nr:hypothetical protein [Caulobacteraceae bacterium]